ncbi:MAG: hypothetical protein JNL58_20260 [Planctomyces sp.]|nr:hypothetical protein [Planctomyces sp.]
MPFNFEKLKTILVCPRTRSDLVHDLNTLVSTSPDHRISYPIVDEIPRLLADESQELSREVWSEIMTRHGRDPVTGEPLAAVRS